MATQQTAARKGTAVCFRIQAPAAAALHRKHQIHPVWVKSLYMFKTSRNNKGGFLRFRFQDLFGSGYKTVYRGKVEQA